MRAWINLTVVLKMQFKNPLSFLVLLFAFVGCSSSPDNSSASKPEIVKSQNAEALVVSCVDFHLMNELDSMMEKRGLKGKYDQIGLAGGSLGATSDIFPTWRETFWSHLAFLSSHQDIKRVILIDHRDCDMYKFALNENFSTDRKKETDVHQQHLSELVKEIKVKYPKLIIEAWLMDSSGKLEPMSPDASAVSPAPAPLVVSTPAA